MNKNNPQHQLYRLPPNSVEISILTGCTKKSQGSAPQIVTELGSLQLWSEGAIFDEIPQLHPPESEKKKYPLKTVSPSDTKLSCSVYPDRVHQKA